MISALTRTRLRLAIAAIAVAAPVGAVFLLDNGPADGRRATTAATDRWEPLATSPLQRTEVGAARIGRFIYVLGGFTSREPGATTNEVARYDIEANSWTLVSPMPIGVNHPAVAAHRGRLYVHGGYAGRVAEPTDRLFRYTPASDTWDELRGSGFPRAAHALVPIGSKLYAPGGAAGRELRLLQIYNPARNRWSTGPGMRVAREHIGAAAAAGDLYVIAGRAGGQNLRVVERYDPGQSRWRRVKPVGVARSGFGAAAVGTRIVVAGGEELTQGGSTIGAVEIFSPRANRWRMLPPMLTPRHGVGVVSAGRLVFAAEGGPSPGLFHSNALEYLAIP